MLTPFTLIFVVNGFFSVQHTNIGEWWLLKDFSGVKQHRFLYTIGKFKQHQSLKQKHTLNYRSNAKPLITLQCVCVISLLSPQSIPQPLLLHAPWLGRDTFTKFSAVLVSECARSSSGIMWG